MVQADRRAGSRRELAVGIVRLALRRPYTFLVSGILVLLLGTSALLRTPTDVFPAINVPVVTVVWYYDGLNAAETERRLSTYTEFSKAGVDCM
jgi:multidrug efflux pump subunit AcrB